ncbi:ClpXP protease specificity-enhancing factor [Thiobacter aerophilum]|uniref:ClpXP protease specificity-enhancing factor n=1 Tax=Thiobacter aerophilum TaxID=3121275 RepID=A0ABV0EES7_9BURK
MFDASTKPYLIRAIYEWCVDQGYTPYLAVQVDGRTRVPMEYVKNGQIVLNISYTATHKLKIDNDFIRFAARFNGVSRELKIPVEAVSGIFAKETGQGLFFQVGSPGAPIAGDTAPTSLPATPPRDEPPSPQSPKPARGSHLKVIK